MVTKLSDGRGQTTLKAHSVTDEWEALVKGAAKRNGQSVADFVVAVTTDAAQAVLKGESAVPAGVPARREDVSNQLQAVAHDMAQRAAEQEARLQAVVDELREDRARQAEAMAELRRTARRGRWR